MKKRGKIIGGVIIVVVLFVVTFFGLRALVEGTFPIKKYWETSDEAYLVALEKLDTFSAEELGSMDIDGVRVYVSNGFGTYANMVWIDFEASAEEIKDYLIENIPQAKALAQAEKVRAEISRKLFKELKEKGLSIKIRRGSWCEQSLLVGLEKLNKLTGQEIKALKGIKFRISSGFMSSCYAGPLGRISGKTIHINSEASLKEIKAYIVGCVSHFEEIEKESGEKETNRETRGKIRGLRENLREKLER